MAQILMMIAMTCQVNSGTAQHYSVEKNQLKCQQKLLNCIMQKRDSEDQLIKCFSQRKAQ